jgi:hypothetical protein
MQTYCAGFVLSLPYDPTLPPPDTPWYNNIECQVVPSMLCCFPDVSVEDLQQSYFAVAFLDAFENVANL